MNRGFTLIETVIYIALLGFLMSTAVLGAYQILQGSNEVSTQTIVQDEGSFVLRKIDWAMSGAQSVDASIPQNLFITRYDGIVAHFQLNTGSTPDHLTLSADGSAGPITTENVNVNAFDIAEIPPSGSTPGGFVATTTIDGVDFVVTKYVR